MSEEIEVKAAVQILWLANGEIRVNYPTGPDGRVNDLLALGLMARGQMVLEDEIRKGGRATPLVESARVIPPIPPFLSGGRGPHPLS